jgi:hypothetical protein
VPLPARARAGARLARIVRGGWWRGWRLRVAASHTARAELLQRAGLRACAAQR